AHSADQSANDRREEAARSGGREPNEGKLGAFRRGLRNDRLVAGDHAVQWRIPTSVGLSFCSYPGRSGVDIHPIFHRLIAPQKNKEGKDQEWNPSPEDLAPGVAMSRPFGWQYGIFSEPPDSLRLPEEQEQHSAKKRKQPSSDVHQIAINVIGPEKLHGSEGDAHHQNRRKNFKSFLPAHHRADQPEGNDDGGNRKNAADHS